MMNDLFLLSKRHEGYFTESDLHRCIHTVSMVTMIAADALKYCELNSHCKNLMVTWVSRLFITTERYNLVKLYFRSIIEFSWRWRAPEVAGPRGDGPQRWRAPEVTGPRGDGPPSPQAVSSRPRKSGLVWTFHAGTNKDLSTNSTMLLYFSWKTSVQHPVGRVAVAQEVE